MVLHRLVVVGVGVGEDSVLSEDSEVTEVIEVGSVEMTEASGVVIEVATGVTEVAKGVVKEAVTEVVKEVKEVKEVVMVTGAEANGEGMANVVGVAEVVGEVSTKTVVLVPVSLLRDRNLCLSKVFAFWVYDTPHLILDSFATYSVGVGCYREFVNRFIRFIH